MEAGITLRACILGVGGRTGALEAGVTDCDAACESIETSLRSFCDQPWDRRYSSTKTCVERRSTVADGDTSCACIC